MPRIRSVKPEFNTSEAIAALSHVAQLHFVKLWTHADDDGRGQDHPKLLKAALWPLDDSVTPGMVDGWQAELEDGGRLVRYEVDGRRYFEILNFTEHQKPQKKSESRFPPVPDDYETPTRGVWEDSPTSPEDTPLVVVGGEVDGEGGSGGKRRSPRRRIPDGWEPSARLREWAAANYRRVEIDLEAEKFRNHARANDRRLADWEQGFRNWVIKADEYLGPVPEPGMGYVEQ